MGQILSGMLGPPKRLREFREEENRPIRFRIQAVEWDADKRRTAPLLRTIEAVWVKGQLRWSLETCKPSSAMKRLTREPLRMEEPRKPLRKGEERRLLIKVMK